MSILKSLAANFGAAASVVALLFFMVSNDSYSADPNQFNRLLGGFPVHEEETFQSWAPAVDIFERQGIEVVLGVQGEDPEVIAHRYLAGTLETTGEVCHEHGFHDCGHDHEVIAVDLSFDA